MISSRRTDGGERPVAPITSEVAVRRARLPGASWLFVARRDCRAPRVASSRHQDRAAPQARGGAIAGRAGLLAAGGQSFKPRARDPGFVACRRHPGNKTVDPRQTAGEPFLPLRRRWRPSGPQGDVVAGIVSLNSTVSWRAPWPIAGAQRGPAVDIPDVLPGSIRSFRLEGRHRGPETAAGRDRSTARRPNGADDRGTSLPAGTSNTKGLRIGRRLVGEAYVVEPQHRAGRHDQRAWHSMAAYIYQDRAQGR